MTTTHNYQPNPVAENRPNLGDRVIVTSKPFEDMDTIITKEYTFDGTSFGCWCVIDDAGFQTTIANRGIIEWRAAR